MNIGAVIGLGLAILFFLVSGTIAYQNVTILRDDDARIRHSHDVIAGLDDVLSTIQDAETGQRGYLLTGRDQYLAPYNEAAARIGGKLDAIAGLTRDNASQQARIETLRRHVSAKLAELKQTIDLRRSAGAAAALNIVNDDRGKAEMDAIRAQLDLMQQEEARLRQQRLDEMADAYQAARLTGLLATLVGIALTLVIGEVLRRATKARERQQWLESGQARLAAVMLGDPGADALGEHILGFLSRFLGAQGGAIFASDGALYRRIATLGVPDDANITDRFAPREGLLGQVAADRAAVLLSDIPEGYLTIGSALGRDKPRHLIISPAIADDVVQGVLELGFLQPVSPDARTFLEQAAGAIGVALRSAQMRTALQNLLEETQRQSDELQVQTEELRVSNEELEEQGNALKEQQVRLEQQQVEMEQTNAQLEEQAQQLETQRDDLARSNAAVELKARELEQTSRYKSDFLANMSHELRTPLNSLLILSKLLGDNPKGNLTEEQVKYATTIQSSGNDLLQLINDILDLSKIEAGHVQIRPESVSLDRLTRDMLQVFQPIADERGLAFDIKVPDDSPATIDTDRQRLEQILKNLLSNAFKFTEKGSVTLEIAPAARGRITLGVTDTGIGIAEEQQREIFEAFRQADGTISRKYGGTGLGLSISRELARLLGGTIALSSTPGEGSHFALTIPLAYDPELVAEREEPVMPPAQAKPASAAAEARPKPRVVRRVLDDRDSLRTAERILLVVEDDSIFASIVRDLAHEMGFQCLVAGTAEEALTLAREHKPSAIVLDVGLPDQSGLAVLDRLKSDVETRHIPVHIVSAADHSQTALSLGAIGYLVKPVQREDLAAVLQTLATKLSTSSRRVLIVEDDPVQRDAVAKLLASGEVETVGVGTVAESLDRLKSETFDCMVLDLSLPDASGFALLETLQEDQGHSFPPVIVYTGHDLSPDDEQRLRRYSDSIIIKGARSPERLLDEVSLFLHQVVTDMPPEHQQMIQTARNRDAILEGRRILIVEDDVRNVYSLTNILEPHGVTIEIARNGKEAIEALEKTGADGGSAIDLVLMDVMMPVMDGLTATRAIRKKARWKKLPIIALTAKAMPDDQQRCIEAGASDYMAKPLDVDKLLSLVRVWMPR
ncbi:CheY-like chemotaxis protein/signal transduction histidine kinase/CHASE3 domain sensor protein [Sphingomonas kyeonggiensis]|uniref:response regulator n=1 Tax=Sphingomonas kyeonggiensis TaxID=1268553 RepID=UPI0027874AB3|nr:response regulator [Sphingomonas kyeonggiensis]MDQ0249635.1 CheY-like chemotaxis protein/signal transduction histidine kinase/CHASE3 domain sensor protein [Sphingomonas kyeonggiensis]